MYLKDLLSMQWLKYYWLQANAWMVFISFCLMSNAVTQIRMSAKTLTVYAAHTGKAIHDSGGGWHWFFLKFERLVITIITQFSDENTFAPSMELISTHPWDRSSILMAENTTHSGYTTSQDSEIQDKVRQVCFIFRQLTQHFILRQKILKQPHSCMMLFKSTESQLADIRKQGSASKATFSWHQ